MQRRNKAGDKSWFQTTETDEHRTMDELVSECVNKDLPPSLLSAFRRFWWAGINPREERTKLLITDGATLVTLHRRKDSEAPTLNCQPYGSRF